jgi:sugar lactone lactonase YvrE
VKRILISVIAVLGLAAGTTVAAAHGGHGHHGDKGKTSVFTLDPDPAANPEGIAVDRRSKSFFVSITEGGDIYRGSLKSDTVAPFIDGEGFSVGLKVKRGKLYVAGGPTGSIKVYDLATKALVAKFETGEGGFLNDLVVTRDGDVYVTDSVRPMLWHVTGEQVEAGSGTPQGLPIDESVITYEQGEGEFNLNGIVKKSSDKLIVVDSNSGELFRIDLNDGGDAIEEIDKIDGATVEGGDGLLLEGSKLVVVTGNPAQLTFVKLKRGAREARVKGTQTSKKLHGPSTVDTAKRQYLVVNADFANSASPPYTVAGLPRKQGHKGHGHDHGDDHGHDKGDHDRGDDHGDDDKRGRDRDDD